MAAGSMGGIASNMLSKPVAALGAVAGLVGARKASSNLLLNPKANDFFAKPSVPRNALTDLLLLNVNAQDTKKGPTR